MSYSGLGWTIGGKAGGSVSYGNGELRTSGSAEGSAEGSTNGSKPKKMYTPVTKLRTTYTAIAKPEEEGFPWLWVGVGAGALLLVGGIAYAATRERR